MIKFPRSSGEDDRTDRPANPQIGRISESPSRGEGEFTHPVMGFHYETDGCRHDAFGLNGASRHKNELFQAQGGLPCRDIVISAEPSSSGRGREGTGKRSPAKGQAAKRGKGRGNRDLR